MPWDTHSPTLQYRPSSTTKKRFYTLLGGKSVEPFHFKYKIGTEIQLLYN